jgi:hypothetical protein
VARQPEQITATYQADLQTLAARVMKTVLALLGHVDTADLDRWWKTVGPQVQSQVEHGWLNARDLGMRYIADHATASGVAHVVAKGSATVRTVGRATPKAPVGAKSIQIVPATWSPTAAETALRITGPVAWKTARGNGASEVQATKVMQVRMLGAAQRIASNGARDTVHNTVEHNTDIVGFRRVHDPAADHPPCYFCAMLLSRGSVYKSAKSAGDKKAGGTEYHDKDKCAAEPLYEHQDDPQEAFDLEAQWDKVTGDKKGPDKVKAWRSYWEAKHGRSDRKRR